MSVDMNQVENAIITHLGLSSFNVKIAIGFLQRSLEKDITQNVSIADCSNEHIQIIDSHIMKRVMNYLIDILNQKLWIAKPRHNLSDGSINWQYGCPECLRGLRSCPIWPSNETPWVHILEDAYEDIRAELFRVCLDSNSVGDYKYNGELSQEMMKGRPMGTGNIFQPYRSPKPSSSSSASSSSSSSSSSNSSSSSSYSSSSPSMKASIAQSTGVSSATNSGNSGMSATDRGDWDVCYLHLHGIDFQENLDLFPLTAKVIRSLPRPYDHAFLSTLSPGAHITPHFGPTNKKLRCMLPLYIPPLRKTSSRSECWLRVADQRVKLVEGQCIVFDDSFQHEAGYDDDDDNNNDGDGDEVGINHCDSKRNHEDVTAVSDSHVPNSGSIPTRKPSLLSPSSSSSLLQRRVVLIADIWHPDFTDDEVRFMSYIMKAQMRMVHSRKNHHHQQQGNSSFNDNSNDDDDDDDDDDDFISVILHNREKLRQQQQQQQQHMGACRHSSNNNDNDVDDDVIVRDD